MFSREVIRSSKYIRRAAELKRRNVVRTRNKRVDPIIVMLLSLHLAGDRESIVAKVRLIRKIRKQRKKSKQCADIC